jgi:ribosome-binding protein aMBF1 (putative translation factor)
MDLSTTVYRVMLRRMEGGLAVFVRRRRGDLGLTQKELADRMGVIPARVSQVRPCSSSMLVPTQAKSVSKMPSG